MIISNDDTTKVHPSIAQTIVRIVDRRGLNIAGLLSILGINSINEIKLHDRMLGSTIDRLWREAKRVTNDDSIGIEFAKHFQLGSLNGLGFCWVASDNLLDGFARLSRFFGVISSAGEIVVTENPDDISIALVLPVPYGVAEDISIDGALALFLKLCQIARDDKVSPLSIKMQRPMPVSSKKFTDFFNCDISYNSLQNELIFCKTELLKKLPIANPELARANDQVVMDYLSKYQHVTIASKVSSIIIELLPRGTPSIKMVADTLFVSEKTLQRKLKANNTSFSVILDDVRLSLAKIYLEQAWRSAGETSYLLGFSEPSNFARWFKKETGKSPIEYRESIL